MAVLRKELILWKFRATATFKYQANKIEPNLKTNETLQEKYTSAY